MDNMNNSIEEMNEVLHSYYNGPYHSMNYGGGFTDEDIKRAASSGDYHNDISLLYPVSKKVKEELEKLYDTNDDDDLSTALNKIYMAQHNFNIPALHLATFQAIQVINKFKEK